MDAKSTLAEGMVTPAVAKSKFTGRFRTGEATIAAMAELATPSLIAWRNAALEVAGFNGLAVVTATIALFKRVFNIAG